MSSAGRDEGSFAAIDVGASSGRVIHGHIAPGRLDLTEVRRFRNGPVTLPDGLYWDALGLYTDVLDGLRDTLRTDPDVLGAAIDTWAVDYGLIDKNGTLLGNPRHYRDPRNASGVESVQGRITRPELFAANGLQYLPFNTLYQFAADPDVPSGGFQALLMPDLLGYWLTGERIAEQTNASTTGLLDPHTGQWNTDLIATLGLPDGLLPGVVPPGQLIGHLTPAVAQQIGGEQPLTLTTIGSHDTASAVVGIPAATPNFGYISCGTWALVGVELDRPVLTDESRQANFTNERGVDDTVRYLTNVMGLWLLSESVRTWQIRDPTITLPDLLRGAAALPPGGPVVDPDDLRFLGPGDMPARIGAALSERGDTPTADPVAITRCVVDSLASTFVRRIQQAQQLSGRTIDVIHVVGGGARNELLCQLTADAAQLPVVAGPVEATAIGNLLIQARTHQVLAGDRWNLRSHLRQAVHVKSYWPVAGRSSWRAP
jgi:rhamnulokinase